jgi:hypothetical protein
VRARLECEHGQQKGHGVRFREPPTVKWCVGGEVVELVSVSWCSTHDSIMKDGVCDWVWGNNYIGEPQPCVLVEDQVWRIK